MKIFVSYARVDKPVCIQIVNMLSAHDVWYDQRLYAGQHWWREILRRLEWCDIFLYLISKDSLESEYCRKELEIARKFERDIVPVLIDKNVTFPDDLGDLQYVDMTNKLDADNVSLLHNSILIVAEHAMQSSGRKSAALKKFQTGELALPVEHSGEMIGEAAKAFEAGQYDRAILLFKQAQSKGFESRFININKMLDAAEQAIAEQSRLLEAQREYATIADLFQYKSMREFACDALVKFHDEFPDYDPKTLLKQCLPAPSLPDKSNSLVEKEFLPMLKWCNIPDGIVRISNTQSSGDQIGERTVRVSPFWISKYPVTNLQFEQFIADKVGYSNPRWWQFSDYATAWFEEQRKPLKSRYAGEDRPRENVNWYEAMAFTKWLSHKTELNLTLPRVTQWQRAAQGDNDRFYPWGNVFNDSFCNTHESQIKCTTSVTHYDKGVSPFGVYDMSGNVWEWCLDKANPDEGAFDYKRAVLGGSFVSPADRAQISFRYYLKPEVRYSSIGFRIVCLPNHANLST